MSQDNPKPRIGENQFIEAAERSLSFPRVSMADRFIGMKEKRNKA
jgi:hypothetical protein